MQGRLEIVARALVALALAAACSSTSTTEAGSGGTSAGGSAGVAATGGSGGSAGGAAGAGAMGGTGGSVGGTGGSVGGTGGSAGGTGGVAGSSADAGDASSDAAPGVKRVFVTSALYTGDLKTSANTTFGPQGADKLCNQHGAKLGGTWVAWLSGTLSAFDRIPPASNGPWYRVDGVTLLFPDRNSLKTTPLVPVATDENGVSYTSNVHAWTGTDLGGTAANALQRCNAWAGSVGFFGQYGNVNSASAAWTNAGAEACEVNKNRLICFEL